MNDATFLARLHAHLDAGRAPLDDGELAAFAAGHPEHLETLAGLRADARELGAFRLHARPRHRRWPWLVAAACAAGAAAALVAVTLRGAPRAAPRPAGRILAASVEEIRPRAHVTAGCTASEPVLASPSHSLTTWTTWTEPR
jgi:hypothetical protein